MILITYFACSDDQQRVRDISVDTAEPDTTAPDTSAGPDTADADTTPDTDTEAPLSPLEATIAALCPGYAAAFCQVDCGCDAAPGFPNDCEATFAAQCATRVRAFLPLVESGQAELRPDGAAKCLENFAPFAAACLPFPADLAFVGCPYIAPPGGFPAFPGLDEPCEGNCADGLRCGSSFTCITPAALGASCGDHNDCDATLACADGTCVAPRYADRGKSCADPSDCSGDTVCLASSQRQCLAPEVNGACEFDEECPAHAWCDSGTCTPGGAEGEPCGNGVVCLDGLACDVDEARCLPLPTEGQRCAMGLQGPFTCAPGLVCHDDLTCGAPPAEGEPCGLGPSPCADGLGCAVTPEGSVCQVKADAGAHCELDDTCREGLFCDFGTQTCAPFLAVGEACTDGNECGPEGACVPDSDFNFRCAPRPGVGEACFLDDCQAGLACRSPFTAGVCTPRMCEVMRF